MTVVEAIANVEMARAWDGEEGDDWTVHAHRYEAASERIGTHLDLAGLIEPTHRVLDVGCGTGKATLDAARIASAGGAVGVDLSSRMLAYARERARAEGVANAEFLQADAQVHSFEPATFDVAISLFGAMFFNDAAGAFANVNRALAEGGRLALLAWRPLEENEWLMAIRGALAMGRELPAPPANGPGPFGLAAPDAVRTTLGGAGFVDVDVTPIDEPVWLGADRNDAWTFVRSGMGIVRGLTKDLDEATKRQALDRLRATIDGYETTEGVLLPSAAWLITARRP
jgi:SAM-dependent methyltransferase